MTRRFVRFTFRVRQHQAWVHLHKTPRVGEGQAIKFRHRNDPLNGKQVFRMLSAVAEAFGGWTKEYDLRIQA